MVQNYPIVCLGKEQKKYAKFLFSLPSNRFHKNFSCQCKSALDPSHFLPIYSYRKC